LGRRWWVLNRKPLGELLLEAGVINTEQLNYALTLKQQRFAKDKIGQVMLYLNYIDQDTLIKFLGKQYGSPTINLRKEIIDEEAVHLIPKEIARRYKVISVGFKTDANRKKLMVAMPDPTNLEVVDTISFITGYSIEPLLAREEDLSWIIAYYYNKKELFRPKSETPKTPPRGFR
jgi:type IV pilus assembly protein PilB